MIETLKNPALNYWSALADDFEPIWSLSEQGNE